MDGTSIRQATRSTTRFLAGTVELGWDRPIPEMTWSVREVVAHIGETLLWYATDLAGGPDELSTMDLRVRPTEEPAQLIATLELSSARCAGPCRRRRHARPAGLSP